MDGKLIDALKGTLSSNAKVLTDPTSADFQALLSRWTNINRATPSAIIVPASESDVAAAVRWCRHNSTPFVLSSGKNSENSTIAVPGVILDLSGFGGVDVDASNRQAVLRGGVRTRELAHRLADAGLFTALPNSHAPGAIPYFLNVGNSMVNSLVGFGSDQILSARVVTAAGEIVSVSEEENADLLYAIRGAGQFFGAVTELVVKCYPFSELGNAAGEVWSGAFVFPQTRMGEVLSALEGILKNETATMNGSLVVGAAPPAFEPSIVVSPRLFGEDLEERAALVFKALHELGPLVARGGKIRIDHCADAVEPLNVHGDFKKLRLAGLSTFEKEHWAQVPAIWTDMAERCPDAKRTSFLCAWESKPVKKPAWDSATGIYNVQFWATNFLWYTKAEDGPVAEAASERVVDVVRSGRRVEECVDLANGHRKGPVEYKYPGEGRRNRLRELKRKWDPDGVFTRVFL